MNQVKSTRSTSWHDGDSLMKEYLFMLMREVQICVYLSVFLNRKMKYITKLILQSPHTLLLQNKLACEEWYHLYKIQLTFGDLLVPAFAQVPLPWQSVLQCNVCWGFQWDAFTFLCWACYCLWFLCSLGAASLLRKSPVLSGSDVQGSWMKLMSVSTQNFCTLSSEYSALHGKQEMWA